MQINTNTFQVDNTASKQRQKSQAKSILRQKHRALTDLFQNLAKLGLSYKSGMVTALLKSDFKEFLTKPLDLNVSFAQFKHT